MLVYRIFAHHVAELPHAASVSAAAARPGEPGHPLYEHRPQRAGRIDHPDYFVWYLAAQQEGAVGETFGNLAVWDASMFQTPFLPGGRRALGIFRLPDEVRLLDLDDPAELVARHLRPSQIVVRNLAVTQSWGHHIWSERDPHDHAARRWDAIRWWSYHRPGWQIIGSWKRPELAEVQELTLMHPAVQEAALVLQRPLTS